jgi:hypothetical protein
MASRYSKTQTLLNRSEYYRFLRQKRDVKQIVQYATPKLAMPTLGARINVPVDTYVWKYGDRLYNMASRYYGDVRYWWVIAWWNAYPTEADLKPGMAITIPLDLEAALQVLGV